MTEQWLCQICCYHKEVLIESQFSCKYLSQICFYDSDVLAPSILLRSKNARREYAFVTDK